ncbi:hypothetical protein LCGC14_1836030 [marine sediment metagenome]|uniref:Methyltransferase type 11 domain-containing protein n=1 Tax=marine sediment metagenome TaxID=412755 RepID=A0A0F9GEQ3_9ZZZZ
MDAKTPDGRWYPLFGLRLLNAILESTPPSTVIDLGCGKGAASKIFLNYGYTVTGISLSNEPELVADYENYTHVKQDMFQAHVDPADILWTAHVMEHMTNVGLFLHLCKHLLKDDGLLGISVPSDSTMTMVDGHLTFWTPAHLIYNLVINGWDCSQARFYREGRDISLMVRKKDVPPIVLNYDRGDLEKLSPYFPVPIIHRVTDPWLADNFQEGTAV